MYAWGSSDNVYIDSKNQSITFNLKNTAGSTITKVAIFPSDAEELETDNIINENSSKFVEYYSGDLNAHQAYSGEYGLITNQDGSATLTMNKLYRDNKMAAEKYQANRCIYVYGKGSDGKEVLLYKTNVVRAATIIPPKKTGSIVLKYDEKLTEDQIQAKLKEALDAPTAAKDGKSVREQIKTASTAFGVGVRPAESEPAVPTQDDPDKKVVITDKQAYDVNQFNRINKPTSQQGAAVTTYTTGVQNLKTYLVSDLGYKSGELALTVARYDTRIDKPTVDDLSKVSDEVKTEIKRKLAHLNHVAEDKVTINDQGEVSINFTDVDAKDAPKIALSELVLKKIAEADVAVPTGDNATFVYNPLAYSDAEIASIKKAIYEANKGNKELGLSEKDYEKQITLSYLTGNLTATGTGNQGISNGRQENAITVKIKTDKAVAEFKSDVTKSRLTKLVNIREDYDVTWNNNKIAGRDSDEGLSWSEDHKTIIYRYDPTKAEAFKSSDVTKLLTATPKAGKEGLRKLTGGEKLDHEGAPGQEKKSHVGYILQDGQPTGELTLGIMKSGYWTGDPQITGTDVNMGDVLAKTGEYKWDDEAQPVKVASKDGKIYRARLFVAPYGMESYQYVYTHPDGKNPNNTSKAINVIFVPQTNHKKDDLSKSIGEHKTENVDGKDVPTQSAYYNASKDKKDAYEKALDAAKTLYESVKGIDESKLTEDQKAQIDNATINLNKAREALDGDATKKEELKKSIAANGKVAEGQTAEVAGTVTTDKYKNVDKPAFLKDDGKPDTKKNEAASKAKTAYDEALAAAEKVNKDDNATQKDVDAAKAKLDAARKELDKYSTNKDKLNAAIAEHGQVNTGKNDQGIQDVTKADPTYQNSEEKERKAYDDAVKKANDLSKDPNASQKDVNDAITALKDAKAKLDAKATNKAKLAAAVQQTFDNPEPTDATKQSTFYKNALNKKNNGSEEEKTKAAAAIKAYDDALKTAKDLLEDKKGTATQAQVDAAVKALTDAEDKLHEYSTNKNDLTKALADNIDGYLKPAYFNAFDKSLGTGADAEAAKKAFKEYNDAYHKAKELKAKFASADASKQPTDEECKAAKEALEQARQVIDTYATDTSKLSAAFWNDLAIQNSPAYKNAKALADKQNPTAEEQAQVAAAKKIKQAYDDAVAKLHKAFSNTLDQDKDAQGTPFAKIPDAKGDPTSKNYLDGVQAHANGEPLDRDVTDILKAMNDAADQLKQFATKTDKLQESIDKDADTQKDPAYKNTTNPSYKKTDDPTADDTEKNGKASAAKTAYDNALKAAKALMVKPDATQKEINDAKTALDNARKALDDYKTDVSKLQESADKHGKDAKGSDPAVEGTKDSDAYRNASDPHFLDAQGKPDTKKNDEAKKAKAAYDKALADAQDLLAKHNDANTPQNAKPTQKQIDEALKTLDEKRKALDAYATKTDALKTEADLSKADTEGASIDGKFENTPEFKNADAKKGEKGEKNPDVKAYEDALKAARDLLAKKDAAKLSERPTQQQVDEALDALKKAKQTIADSYKTDATLLKDAKDFANGGFKQTPEYKNAVAIKDDTSATADQQKKTQANTDVSALDENTENGALKKAIDILNKFDENGKPKQGEANIPTQKEVDEALGTLKAAMDKVTNDYPTKTDELKNEVGDKDEQGKDVVPPFEASVPYKNALAKKNDGDATATEKLKAYVEKLAKANELIEKVKNPDPNAKPEDRPSQDDVDKALKALKAAKKDIDDNFKTKVEKLQNEVDDKNEDGSTRTPEFEKSTEFANLKAKQEGDKKPDDLVAYEQALAKAKELIDKNDGKVTKDGQEVDVPKDQLPTQTEVDEAQKALKEIKDKIIANYKTNPHDLSEEAKMSKFGDDDKRDTTFENSAAFKNASAKTDDDAAKQDLQNYKDKLDAANKLLAAFDLTNGGVKKQLPDGMTIAPTQQELDAALKALQDAKAKIENDYATKKEDLTTEYDERKKENSSDYSWASGTAQTAYTNALNDAQKVLNNKNATQKEVDAALQKLKDTLKALEQSASANRLAGYATIVADSRDALRKLVEENASTHLKALYTQADAASQREFISAMDNAKQLLANQDALATELDAARVRLLKALAELAKHQLPNSGDASANASAAAEDADATGTGRAAGKTARSAKHLVQTSDPTNALAAAGFLASALGFITMGFKTKKRREK